MALLEANDYGAIVDRACWAMFATTALAVALRVFCRVHWGQAQMGGGLGLDDYITLTCLAVFLATCILVTIGSHYGLGRHYTSLSSADQVIALRYNVIVSAVLIWTFSLPKFAIIATLKRILNYGTKTMILFWGLALTSQACIFATSVWWFAQCRPVARGWDKTIAGECASIDVLADLGYFTSAYSAFLDIFFALYPIPFIMRLNMPFKTRVAVSSALGLSSMAFVISIYKLAIFGQVFAIMAKDPTYPVTYLDSLGVAEGCILMVCASLPTLGPLYRAIKTKVNETYGSRQNSRNPLDRSNHGHSRGIGGSKKWDYFNGHKLEDPEQPSGTRPSTDVIPLVTTKNSNTQGGLLDIHKTVVVSVSSESLEGRSQHAGTSI